MADFPAPISSVSHPTCYIKWLEKARLLVPVRHACRPDWASTSILRPSPHYKGPLVSSQQGPFCSWRDHPALTTRTMELSAPPSRSGPVSAAPRWVRLGVWSQTSLLPTPPPLKPTALTNIPAFYNDTSHLADALGNRGPSSYPPGRCRSLANGCPRGPSLCASEASRVAANLRVRDWGMVRSEKRGWGSAGVELVLTPLGVAHALTWFPLPARASSGRTPLLSPISHCTCSTGLSRLAPRRVAAERRSGEQAIGMGGLRNWRHVTSCPLHGIRIWSERLGRHAGRWRPLWEPPLNKTMSFGGVEAVRLGRGPASHKVRHPQVLPRLAEESFLSAGSCRCPPLPGEGKG